MQTIEFSYFDQFQEMEIDLSKYLQDISSSANYEYSFSNMQPVKTTIKNIFNDIDFFINYKSNSAQIINYKISDYELPEQISKKVYGVIDYWWIVYIFNGIRNPFLNWPVPGENLNELADQLFADEGLYTRVTYFDMLFELNEIRRDIILPNSQALYNIISAYRNILIK